MLSKYIQASIGNIIRMTKYHIDESTVVVLDEQTTKWIAEVTTTFNKKRGADKMTFAILVTGDQFIIIEYISGSIMINWFTKRMQSK